MTIQSIIHKYLLKLIKLTKRSLLGLLALLFLHLLLRSWNTTLSDNDVREDWVEFLILTNGSEDVVWNKSLSILAILSAVGFLEDFFNNLLENGSHIDWSIRWDTFCISALLHVSVNTTNWEDNTSTCGSWLLLLIDCHNELKGVF